jgi:macrolide-specific efflux system membrane fusion protein
VPRPVLVGLKTRTQAEILYGLEPGETVVTGTSQGAMPAMSGLQRGGMRPAPRFR